MKRFLLSSVIASLALSQAVAGGKILKNSTDVKEVVKQNAQMGVGENLEESIKNFGEGLDSDKKSAFDDIMKNISKLNKKIVKKVSKLNIDDTFDKEKDKFKDSLILSYKKNYILPVVYDNVEHSDERKKVEAKMQISLLFPIYKNFLSTTGDLYYGYTAYSVWQIYNNETSAEFRDTNHQPELILHFQPEYIFYGIKLSDIFLAVIHQSNGQNIPESRSWNRNNLEVRFKKGNFTFGANLWHRWGEDEKADEFDTQGDDNPDLEDFIGRGNIFVKYDTAGYSLALKHQNDPYAYNLKYGHTQMDIILPSFNKNFKWYIQYFNGYGESLIDYNERVHKIGLGVYINEWSL